MKIKRSWFDRQIPYLEKTVFILRRAPHQYVALTHEGYGWIDCYLITTTRNSWDVLYLHEQPQWNETLYMWSMAKRKTSVTPARWQWSYCSFALNHRCVVHFIHHMHNHHPEREWKFFCKIKIVIYDFIIQSCDQAVNPLRLNVITFGQM